MAAAVSREAVLQALAAIQDPDLGVDIVQAGFVQELTIDGGRVAFDLVLTTPACPLKEGFRRQAEAAVAALPGVREVVVRLRAKAAPASPAAGLAGVRHVVAVASGKGGVGKSTVAVNLAVALSRAGARVGLLDVDIYGPSAQIMLGIPRGTAPEVTPEQELLPVAAHGLEVMSMAFLARDDTPILWRGPLVAKLVQDFLVHVRWGELDYLVVDLPPGTGDAQLTLCQAAPLAGAVIVTTPQDVSLVDAAKGLELFRKVNVPVLGIVENMSYYVCPHCGERAEIFRHGGGARVAGRLGVPFLGEIPLEAEVALAGDEGVPIVARRPDGAVGRAYGELAGAVARHLSVLAARKAGGPEGLALDWAAAPALGPEEGTPAGGPGSGDAPLVRVFKVDERTLGLHWGDGRRSYLPARLVRLACPCAGCVDEATGRRTLAPERIPADIRPVRVEPVGGYAVRVVWSDGHDTGLYSFALLRELDPARG